MEIRRFWKLLWGQLVRRIMSKASPSIPWLGLTSYCTHPQPLSPHNHAGTVRDIIITLLEVIRAVMWSLSVCEQSIGLVFKRENCSSSCITLRYDGTSKHTAKRHTTVTDTAPTPTTPTPTTPTPTATTPHRNYTKMPPHKSATCPKCGVRMEWPDYQVHKTKCQKWGQKRRMDEEEDEWWWWDGWINYCFWCDCTGSLSTSSCCAGRETHMEHLLVNKDTVHGWKCTCTS